MPFEISLKGKLAMVTGGGRGLGIAIARSLATAGADLALTYNSSPADKLAEELSKEFGVKARAFKMSGGSSRAIDEAVKKITEEMGEIDIVVANAGVCIHQNAEDMTDEEFDEVMKINAYSPFWLSRAVYRSWFPTPDTPAKDKVILYVSSISGLITNTPQNQCAYNASKAALTHLATSLAIEWVSKGVRVNSLLPGYIKTEMSEGSESGKVNAETWRKLTPMNRFAEPKEIADHITWMASPHASFQTGAAVVVDGGYVCL